jgi:hypothetical protein
LVHQSTQPTVGYAMSLIVRCGLGWRTELRMRLVLNSSQCWADIDSAAHARSWSPERLV